jgi:parallel beta-helix repeat protein
VDRHPGDGRAFLLAFGGRMDITHADVGYLGFGTGTSSGVAWRGGEHPVGQPGRPAIGDVASTVLHHNWFGAYTFEAADMRWTGDTFRDNDAYGFDPHDSSDDFVVVDNVAHGNGRHGFIFSRGCDRNLLRNNVAYDNRGHGFMIDDGRSESTTDAAAARLPSNDNVLVGNRAYANDGSGIEIEGGQGTVIEGNLLERNHVGVRVKNDASVLVKDNRLVNSLLAGIDVLAGAGTVRIQGNRITGGWAGVALSSSDAAALTGNSLHGPSTPLVVSGEPQREDGPLAVVGRVFRWNPLLILWVAILGVPTVLTLRHLVRTTGRHRRRVLVRG